MFNLLASPCYSVAMQLSNLTHIYQARRILTLNEQVNELFTNKIYIKQFKIIAQNLGPRKKYYSRSSATSFRLKVYLPVCYTNGAFKNSNVLLNMTVQYNRKHHKISSVVPCVWMYYVYMLVNDFRIIWDLVPSKAREQIEYLGNLLTTYLLHVSHDKLNLIFICILTFLLIIIGSRLSFLIKRTAIVFKAYSANDDCKIIFHYG